MENEVKTELVVTAQNGFSNGDIVFIDNKLDVGFWHILWLFIIRKPVPVIRRAFVVDVVDNYTLNIREEL